jgi:beta-glucosidase
MDQRIERLVAELTLEEKVSLLGGLDMWHSPGVPRLGIPALKVTDGPSGARGGSFSEGPSAACFPCGTALAATWHPELVARVGEALGQEARSKGAHVLLAPTVNIHRSPLGGRNFECYSEDPHLAARIAVAFVRGVQSQGVGTSIKHFVCNDSEFERHTISSEVDERALREIYLVPFEAAVEEADPWSVMAAYNRLNGTYCAEHERLLGDILRGEWGFEGFVVSDWFGTRSTADAVTAGLDLEMPGPPRFMGEKLLTAVQAGDVAESVVDAAVRRALRARLRAGAFESPEEPPERAIDLPEHRRVARAAAAEAIVLLKNEGNALPLDASALESLAVIGPNADAAHIQGGGSARVPPHYAVTPLEGIRERAGGSVEVRFELGCTSHRSLPALDARHVTPGAGEGERGLRVEYFNNLDLSGEPALVKVSRQAEFYWLGAFAAGVDPRKFSARVRGTFTAPEAGAYTFGLTSAGLSRLFVDGRQVVDNWTSQSPGESFFGAGSAEVSGAVELERGQSCELCIEYARRNAPVMAGLKVGCLPPVPDDALERAVARAASCDAAVVVVGLNAEWETEGRDRLDMELPSRQAELIERVAAANPNTIVVVNAGAPVRMDWIDAVPAALQLWYPGQECGNALADVLFGDVNPSGKLPQTFPKRLEDTPAYRYYPGENGKVVYGEGVFVGYRHYDARGIEPRFPFGHGLSYTRFDYADLRVSPLEAGPGDPIELAVDVANAGSRAGQEVVQLYVRDVEASVSRPERELRGFAKLELQPGERRTLRFALEPRALSFWDPARAQWVAEPGEFEVLVGSSSRDIRARTAFALKA